jgi:hypothetical protein
MVPMRAAPSPIRFAWAALLFVALAMRLVTPSGFMPVFDHGRLMILECPGTASAPMPPMSGMNHDHGKTCQSCPHATATGPGLIDAEPVALPTARFLTTALIPGHAFALSLRPGEHERPPAIGPPIPA